MNGKVHALIGVGTVACITLANPRGFTLWGTNILPAISLATAAAGSFMPDVDNPRTHAGHQHKVTSKVVSKVGGGHRGITHSLIFPAVILALMYYISTFAASYKYIASLLMSLLFGYVTGWIMHIFADLFNGKGCPILMPLSKSKIHIVDLPSTGVVPWIFAVALIALMALLTIGGF